MKSVFTVDGISYNVIVTSLKRSFQVLDTDKAGRAKSGSMIRDIIGTYYNYSIEIEPHSGAYSEYDRLYEVLSSPDKDFHTVTFPYGQDTLTFKAYVTDGEDELLVRDNGNRWSGLTLKFVAKKPQRKPQ